MADVPTRDEAMADRSRTVYMIVFDDADRPPEMVIGDVRAARRFHDVSVSWNAHLFGKIKSNSRDDPHYADNITRGAAATTFCENIERGSLVSRKAVALLVPLPEEELDRRARDAIHRLGAARVERILAAMKPENATASSPSEGQTPAS